MTSDPSEATHFRGRTLTPESPVPIHVLESSSNIPVLQNQIDPIFNLTSTHLQPAPMVSETDMAALQNTADPLNSVLPETGQAAGDSTDSNFISFEGNQELDADGDDDSAISYGDEIMTDQQAQNAQATNILQNHSFSAAPPSTSVAYHESSSTLPTDETSSIYAILNQSPLEGALEHTTGPSEPSQNAPSANDQIPPDHEPDLEPPESAEARAPDPEQIVKDGGVNYESLLESLSPSYSTAPNSENLASTAPAIPAESSVDHRPSSVEQPLSALPLPAGLPPRPPPQEKPAIHPNYNAENDISTYHFPQGQNSNAHPSHTPQPSNSYLPPSGFPQAVLTPKTSVGANGLPPPPLATFQQPSPQADQVQPSPFASQNPQSDGKKETLQGQSAEENDDEVPWTLEIERLWDEFQKEEAVYVSEGLWDRFPQGSRLFVGMRSPQTAYPCALNTSADQSSRESLHRESHEARSFLHLPPIW